MIQEVRDLIKIWAEEFGAKNENEFTKSYIERKNIDNDVLDDKGAFFGFIHPEEESSGPYHDYSFVIFPTNQELPWVVSLCVGSSNFKRDFELASRPGLRRLFSMIIDENGYCATDLTNINSSLPRDFTQNPRIQHLSKTIGKYSNVMNCCQIIDNPLEGEGKKYIKAFLAAYAKMRDWPTNNDHRNSISEALKPLFPEDANNDKETILNLLKERRYVVLQGPPGTGKTTLAKEIAAQSLAKTFFTQFHAETTYSDFIYGIRPRLNANEVGFKEEFGDLAKSIKFARDNPSQKTILIIDEINRANLSNVLGPVFYLFEHKMKDSNIQINITPDLEIKKLPKNYYVIATMNTADRSLAVVDFALRRRFAWYNKKPKFIEGPSKRIENIAVNKISETEFFFKEDFAAINEIFNWYASSNELNLQPGEGYFIASNEKEMENRIRYEIFPLIKEYLQEGLLTSAVEEFNNYFLKRIDQSLFE